MGSDASAPVEPTTRDWASLLFVGGGVLLIVMCVDNIVLYFRAKEAAEMWRTVPGTITKGGITEKKKGKETQYREIDVEYLYTVDGQQYTGNRFALSGDVLDKQIVDRILSKWQIGGTIEIAYNPATPGESCVKETLRYGAIIRVPAVAAGVIGPILIGYGIRRWLKNRKPEAPVAEPSSGSE